MSASRVTIQLDECKPHWAMHGGLDKYASECGMRDAKVTGDFDLKITYITGDVEDVKAFRARVAACAPLRESSVYEVSNG
jgi:hypothetical protein